MRPLRKLTTLDVVTLATAAATFALPPTSYAIVPDSWTDGQRVVPEFELELWTDTAAVAVTAAILYGAVQQSFTFADITVTGVTHAANTFTKSGHGLLTGDGPIDITSTVTVPGSSSSLVGVFVIKVDANTFKVARTVQEALAGTPIVLSDDGSGTIKAVAEVACLRVHWATHDGLLGLAGDGAIALGTQAAYRKRVPHSPRVIAYSLVATLDTGAASAALVPIINREP